MVLILIDTRWIGGKGIWVSLLGWFCFLNVSVWGQFSGGSGALGDPYLISDANDVQAIGLDLGYWGKHFRMTGDVDMGGAAVVVIGSLAEPFSGTFDGGGFVLANLVINLSGSDNVGLFGVVENGVDPNTIMNLGLIGCDISGRNRVGGLVGYLKSGVVRSCYAAGEVAVTGSPGGGLVGLNNGMISGCSSSVQIEGMGFVGVLVGNNAGVVSDSSATGQVDGTNAVGGLVGYHTGSVSQCWATGLVGGVYYVGGLVGYNLGGMIVESYATGAATGANSRVGGLVGVNDNGSISDCYATGAANGFVNVGGLVGRNYKSTISNCYSTGAANGSLDVGGLVGYSSISTVSNSYWPELCLSQ